MKSAGYFSELSLGRDFVLKVVIILQVLQLHLSLIMFCSVTLHTFKCQDWKQVCVTTLLKKKKCAFEDSNLVNLVILQSILSYKI
jgi:hypothetical protein